MVSWNILLSVGNQTQRGQGVHKGRIGSQLRWVPSTSGKRCANSGAGGHRVTEMTRTDGPGFSLCAVPLELSGPRFCSIGQRLDE